MLVALLLVLLELFLVEEMLPLSFLLEPTERLLSLVEPILDPTELLLSR